MPYMETPSGTRLFYAEAGPAAAAPVIFSNSLGTTHRMWDKVVVELADRYRCVRYDTRGHGGSGRGREPFEIADLADDVAALLGHLGLPRAHVAGLSLGGMVGQAFAVRHPDRLAGLSLIATAACMPPRAGWEARAATVRAEGTQAILDATLERWFTPGFRAAAPDAVAAVAADFLAIDRDGYAACCEAIARMDLRPILGSVRARTTIIAGREDPATPPAMAREIQAGIAGARLVELSPGAHLVAVEQPGRVAAELRRDLAQSFPSNQNM